MLTYYGIHMLRTMLIVLLGNRVGWKGLFPSVEKCPGLFGHLMANKKVIKPLTPGHRNRRKCDAEGGDSLS
jgi:hypothetical protein